MTRMTRKHKTSAKAPVTPEALQSRWLAEWPAALSTWSKFTRLSLPRWCYNDEEAKREGLTDSFAMIRLNDQAIVINLALIARLQLGDFAREIMAHEIGHHVLCPADLTDNARMIARMRWALPTREHLADFIGNLYTDLLINDRLQRSAGLRISDVFLAIGNGSKDRMWTLYMRIYEILWSIRRGTLATGVIDARLEGDAQLGARLVRSYARDWLDGAGRFAALCLPYLLEDGGIPIQKILSGWRDTKNAGAAGSGVDAMPSGLATIEPGEREGAVHPALDPNLTDGLIETPAAAVQPTGESPAPPSQQTPIATGQYREPFAYGQILKALGIDLPENEVAIRYYRELALPHLIRYPTRVLPESTEPLPEGLETWDIGEPLENADWLASILISPRIVPGLTTMQRVYGATQGGQPDRLPLDLDLYIDCSGSMLNPQVNTSYLALAATIITLSALRAGARVQATLWSGPAQYKTTSGFIRDEHHIMQIITGYLGGTTAFPIHLLRDTYQARKPTDRAAHILVISDDGVTTMFDKDEKGNSGWDIASLALTRARGGGTLALNLADGWDQPGKQGVPILQQARGAGWHIGRVRSWDELIEFARVFSSETYAKSE